MRRHDKAALQMALELVLNHEPDPHRRKQVETMLKEQGWWRAATFSAYHLQHENLQVQLNTRPWHPMPMDIDLKVPRDATSPAGLLWRRMKELGISRFHPDPLTAVASAEKRAVEAARGEILATAAQIVPMPEPRRAPEPEAPPPERKPVDVL